MTERGRQSLRRDASSFTVGPSGLAWDDTGLALALDEVTFPIPGRVRGRVRLRPEILFDRTFPLDAGARHHWWPIAPLARIEVALERPALAWRGSAYLDSNWGAEPLEAGFSDWSWSRASRGRDAVILYDAHRRHGGTTGLALRFTHSGAIETVPPPPIVDLPRTRIWRMQRPTRADAPDAARVVSTFEDTPFYSRSLLATSLLGERVPALHESLSLDRFAEPVVQAMLPFRMPRRR